MYVIRPLCAGPLLIHAFYLLAGPKFSEVMQDTKVLLQQSRERLVITYVRRLISLWRLHIDYAPLIFPR